ncbi:MAG: class I SAM-dependent methyltransferase [Rhodospirillaceae bacterium]|nr:class I SAM-dependent methyltransferase [Rhodospirillaceae bacterium]
MAPLDSASPATRLPSIEAIPAPTHDEAARQGYVSMLRKYVMADLANDMRASYDAEVAPAFKKAQGRAPKDGREVRRAMLGNSHFRFYSVLRYNAQEMTWLSVQDSVERALPELSATATAAATSRPAGGTLRLNPDVDIPRAVSALDIHLMPGCYHTEFMENDVAVAAMYSHGTRVFGAGLRVGRPRTKGGVADSIGHYLKLKYPTFRPKRILDLGCTTGSNLLPYLDVFPEAEGYGVDVGAPLVRYAHAKAEAAGKRVHYSQQNAEKLDFPDGHFDLVVSSFFLHELSVGSTRKILKEIYRVLKPGGLMAHMELPPANVCDPYYNFYLDWDAFYNNEPHYAAFRAQDTHGLCVEAGFEADKCDQTRIPDRGVVSDEYFAQFAQGKVSAPQHGNFASWFIFGALK